MTEVIPELKDTDGTSIRAWFANVSACIGGNGWHADDDPRQIVNSATGRRLFTDAEAIIISHAMERIRVAANSWPDPNLLYDLAAQGTFDIEEMYPGFLLDRSLISSRLGSVTIPDRDVPNLVVEEFGQYALLEFPDQNLHASEQNYYILKPIDKDSVARHPIDPKTLVVREDVELVFLDINDLEEKLVELAERGLTISP